MFDRVRVIGNGRAGQAIAGRLRERGVIVDNHDPDLVLLCIPDSVIPTVARDVTPGPWVAHVSGATPLSALAPHVNRFSVHPLQTLVLSRGPEQLDGAFAAITAESADGWSHARWLAATLGLVAFELTDDNRALYHAGAAMASNYLVTLYRAAAALVAQAGAPPDALLPLMQRTIENGFELTGPIARGDWATVGAHLEAIHNRRPDIEPLYRALAEATRP
jgi:predicted short-subunit dehydrogenase-like oxidoreductase (DUF2520 family)